MELFPAATARHVVADAGHFMPRTARRSRGRAANPAPAQAIALARRAVRACRSSHIPLHEQVCRPGNGRDTVMLCANTMGRPRPMLETEVQSPLDAARKLALIRSYAEEIEATRELPRPLFEALADAGMLHLALTHSGLSGARPPHLYSGDRGTREGRRQHRLGDQSGCRLCDLRGPDAARGRARHLDRYAARRRLQHPHPERSGGRGPGRVQGHGRAGLQHGLPACLLGGSARPDH